MTAIERNVIPSRGARFFREGGEILFEFVIDPTNIIGPRKAKERDSVDHAEAWGLFLQSVADEPQDDAKAAPEAPEALPEVIAPEPEPFNGADPAKFDHDGDGEPGGSKPARKVRGPYKSRKAG